MISEAEQHVIMVYNIIKSAAMLIESIDPNALLESWERQETVLPFIDPSAAQKIYAARDDMARKKAIIQAAANFLNAWNKIKSEALKAEGGKG